MKQGTILLPLILFTAVHITYLLLLLRNTNEEHLKEIFGNYGVVKRAKINRRDNTAISQGIGFVEMNTEEEGALAIDHLDGSQIDGRNVSVNHYSTGVKVFATQTFVSPFDPIKKRHHSRHSSRSRSRSRNRSRSRSHHHRRRNSYDSKQHRRHRSRSH